jgi:hypothetical protein
MWRTYFAVLAIVLPVILGLGLVYLFTAGTIGAATAIAGCFALAAFAVTAVVLHEDADETDVNAERKHVRLGL